MYPLQRTHRKGEVTETAWAYSAKGVTHSAMGISDFDWFEGRQRNDERRSFGEMWVSLVR